jgi:hypothetical protein
MTSQIEKSDTTHYIENGLVLTIDKSFRLMFEFLKQLSQDSAKGKGRQNLIETGVKIAKECYESRNYQISIRVMQILIEQSFIVKEPIPEELHLLYSDSVFYLLSNIFSGEIDYMYALGCMISLPKEKANLCFKNSLQQAGKDYNRLHKIALVGSVSGLIWNQRAFQVNCLGLVKHTRWLQEFLLLEIPFDESLIRSKDIQYHKSMIPYIIFKGGLDIALEFAEEYTIEDDYCLKQNILQQLLLENFDRFRVIKTLEKVQNRELLVKFLMDLIDMMSPYDYEGY